MSGRRVSGRIASASRKFSAHSVAATQPGPATPNQWMLNPPSAGPKMKPNPNAMPINPIFFERDSGGVTSAMHACATVMFAPQIPASTRETRMMTSAVCASVLPGAVGEQRVG